MHANPQADMSEFESEAQWITSVLSPALQAITHRLAEKSDATSWVDGTIAEMAEMVLRTKRGHLIMWLEPDGSLTMGYELVEENALIPGLVAQVNATQATSFRQQLAYLKFCVAYQQYTIDDVEIPF